MSFMVMSSSLLAPSISTLGRMATGGTGTTRHSRSSGRHPMSSTSRSSGRMPSNSDSARSGCRSSAILGRGTQQGRVVCRWRRDKLQKVSSQVLGIAGSLGISIFCPSEKCKDAGKGKQDGTPFIR